LAALRLGITSIVIPERNVSDLRDIPKELKKRIEFIPVRQMREVLDVVLTEPLEWKPSPRKSVAAPAAPTSPAPAHAKKTD
ncbi:MAG: S16 family serine protease, partial [Myxococcota bacterium]